MVPFLSKNLAPGEEFTISMFINNFTEASFPIIPRVFGYSTNEFARQQIGKIEILRQSLLQSPTNFGLTNKSQLVINAANRDSFIIGALGNFYTAGLLTPKKFLE